MLQLLLFAVQKTTQFEQWLASKFKPALGEVGEQLSRCQNMRANTAPLPNQNEIEEDEAEAAAIAEEEKILQEGSEADKVRVKYIRAKREKEHEERLETAGKGA